MMTECDISGRMTIHKIPWDARSRKAARRPAFYKLYPNYLNPRQYIIRDALVNQRELLGIFQSLTVGVVQP